MTEKELNQKMDNKWKRLLKKYPDYNASYLRAYHRALDWYDKELKKIS